MLDIYVRTFEFLSDHSYLNWGYWDDPDSVKTVNAIELIDAQVTFLERFMSFVPDGVKTILEIGSGTGELARLLQQAGYEVECVCPSFEQNRWNRTKTAPGTVIYESRFEDAPIDKEYDLAIFCESFQYMDLPVTFEKLRKFAKQVLITDFHKISPRGRQGGGFIWADFKKAHEASGFEIVTHEDITRNVKPNLMIKRRFYLELYIPVVEIISERIRQKYPFLSRFFLGFLERRLFAVARRRQKGEGADASQLTDWIEYVIMVLRRTD